MMTEQELKDELKMLRRERLEAMTRADRIAYRNSLLARIREVAKEVVRATEPNEDGVRQAPTREHIDELAAAIEASEFFERDWEDETP
jgi:hypothetical protein